MILTGNKIKEEIFSKKIVIEPYLERQITTNSYDLRLGDDLLFYTEEVLDVKKKPCVRVVTMSDSGYVLEKGSFCLASSIEIIGSNNYVPIIHAKSGIARMGLFVHCSTGLFDIGSIGQVTFQLYSTLPIRVYPGMLIAQVTFWKPQGDIDLYAGKYQSSKGPRASEIYKDFKIRQE